MATTTQFSAGVGPARSRGGVYPGGRGVERSLIRAPARGERQLTRAQAHMQLDSSTQASRISHRAGTRLASAACPPPLDSNWKGGVGNGRHCTPYPVCSWPEKVRGDALTTSADVHGVAATALYQKLTFHV